MSSDLLDKGYEPKAVEERWNRFWLEENLFSADAVSDQKSFSIVIPPPNVTGVLHMGHALNNTLQDILCRYRRLRGDNVLWMPGTDHAGIATQNVVEKELAREGKTRHDLGREALIEAVWEWREKYGSAIINQLKRLGASCDWDRERFTMDEGLSQAVRKVFVELYEEGLIYKGNYIINWCPRCLTALADLEVEHEESEGRLYHILYPFPNQKGGIVVATTRPETMLGDTAVAVNPDDERYADLTEDSVILPLMNRKIPVVRDKYVDMSFGTGGLKVTPAHDPNDFEIGVRHNLPAIKVIGDDGIMTSEAGRFQGLDRFKCRAQVVKALEKENLLKQVEPHQHSVGCCYRCNTVIEPNLSKQWFVKAKPLADKAIEAVESGKTRIIPTTWENTYYDWMRNIKDWCISRQIWWGHQIPAWTCGDCEEITVSMDTPETCVKCGSKNLVRETDVLDTWFSSALWPFSTLGWPEKTELLKTFYPTSVLVTAFDILFFWVARMMMMGIHFMKDVPFKDVYIHAIVRDEEGKKMSKSTGNVIDPLVVIDQYGTDAFRFTLTAFAAQGRDVRMSEKRVEGYRHFVNKLWNAARFSLMHIQDGEFDAAEDSISRENERLSLPDRWILSKLDRLTTSVSDSLETYHFNEAASNLYQFVWHEFCDWYLEAIKPVLYGKHGEEAMQASKHVLWKVLKDTVILLHPIIPFITEEIWSKLPGTKGSIMQAVFPGDQPGRRPMIDPDAESHMALVVDTITGIRNIRGEMGISPSMALSARIQSDNPESLNVVREYASIIKNLARLNEFMIDESGEKPKSAAMAVASGMVIYVDLEGVIDFEKESLRLEKEITKIAKELTTISKKLNNEDFLAKAPDEVVQNVREKNAGLIEKQQKLQSNLERVRKLHED